MSHTDPSHVHIIIDFIVRNLDAIVTGAAVVVLITLRVLGRKEPAQAAIDIIKEKPVTHDQVDAKLARCQLQVTKDINDSFNDFREEIMKEIRLIHTRINTLR